MADSGLLTRCAVCGLIAVLLGAVFHLKRESIRLPAPDADAFLGRVGPVLAELGYATAAQTETAHAFRPAFHSLLFGSGIRVEWGGGWATVSGPRVYLEVLRRRLRVQGYVEQASRSAVRRRSERLLRRVELGLRVEPGQWQAVHGGVIEVLRRTGADVICHLSILAQGEAGIRATVVEGEVRGWLTSQQIPAEIHTEPLSLPGHLV